MTDLAVILAESIDEKGRLDDDAVQIDEIPDGYASRIPTPDAMLGTIAEFLAFERWCRPFIIIVLDLAPNECPLTLRLRGPAAFKDFLHEEIATHLGLDISAAATSSVGTR